MATNATAALNAQFQYREIDLQLIDEPQRPERKSMEEQELAELALNIADVGLLKPLIVKPVADRFEVIAGHRRLLACRIAESTPVPCRVVVNGIYDPLSILVAENEYTEAVNAVEQAEFFMSLLMEKCDEDVDKLCALVRRNRGFVEDRLLLLYGHAPVVEALRNRKISIAVAKGLNKCKDPNRALLLLDTAINSGATARQVAEWVKDADGLPSIELPAADSADADTSAAVRAYNSSRKCFFCDGTDDSHMLEMTLIHSYCLRMLLRQIGAQPQAPAA